MTSKLLFFHAPWCPPCKFFDREFIKPLAKEVGQDKIQRINAEEEPQLAEQYGVTRLPRAMVLVNDKVVDSAVGFSDLEHCIKILGGKDDKAGIFE